MKLKTTSVFNLRHLALTALSLLVISLSASSCSKSGDKPSGGVSGIHDYGTHSIDDRLPGQWMWTSGSDAGYYNADGTWSGSAYGFAYRMNVDAKGNGTLYSHIFSNLGPGSYLEVNIYYTGYYEMDGDGNLTFYSMGGRYVSSSGTDRALSGEEIYNPSTGTGRTVSFPAVEFGSVSNREAFTTTSSGQTEPFFKQ